MKKIIRVKFREIFLLLFLFLFSIITITVNAQSKNVTGTIVDPEGIGLPGVNVVVKGTTIGTVSDFNGNYTLTFAVITSYSIHYTKLYDPL